MQGAPKVERVADQSDRVADQHCHQADQHSGEGVGSGLGYSLTGGLGGHPQENFQKICTYLGHFHAS